MQNIFPIPQLPAQNPSISMHEFYSGNCPPTINPETRIPLDLEELRDTAEIFIRGGGYIPA